MKKDIELGELCKTRVDYIQCRNCCDISKAKVCLVCGSDNVKKLGLRKISRWYNDIKANHDDKFNAWTYKISVWF